jgi:hypothetical protein
MLDQIYWSYFNFLFFSLLVRKWWILCIKIFIEKAYL